MAGTDRPDRSERQRRQAARVTMARWSSEKLKPCGTRAAYMRHYRAGLRGEDIDPDCRAANSRYNAEHRDESEKITQALYAAAMWRARRDLTRRHPDEYNELFSKWLRELRKQR